VPLVLAAAFEILFAFIDTLSANELYPVKTDFKVWISAFLNASSSSSISLPFPTVIPILERMFSFASVIPVNHTAFLNTSFELVSPACFITSL